MNNRFPQQSRNGPLVRKTAQPMPEPKDSTVLNLDLIKFSTIALRWSRVRDEFSATGAPEADLLKALRFGHNIVIDTQKSDPLLYFVISTAQMSMLDNAGDTEPGVLTILGTAQVISLDRDDAIARFRELAQKESR